MKSKRSRSRRSRVLHLWTRPEVEKAIPYLRSVVGSLREHWLELLNEDQKLRRDAKNPERPRRDRLIAMQDTQADRDRAQSKFDDALGELNSLDVYLLDAVQGVAMIPFRKGDELAWFVFDQFTNPGLAGWRLHEDPFEARRPLNLLELSVSNRV